MKVCCTAAAAAALLLGACARDAELSLRVADGKGKPVSGAEVELVPLVLQFEAGSENVRGVTDENGEVKLRVRRANLDVLVHDGACIYRCPYGFLEGQKTSPLGMNLHADDGCDNGRTLMVVFFPAPVMPQADGVGPEQPAAPDGDQ